MIEQQREALLDIHGRLLNKNLLQGQASGVSTRIPGTKKFWLLCADEQEPELIDYSEHLPEIESIAIHAHVYEQRTDVCAVAFGHGNYGGILVEEIGSMPGVFDEQIRHLGSLHGSNGSFSDLTKHLKTGTNVLSVNDELLVLGMTAQRLILNATLLEKCANAYTLANVINQKTTTIPWLVRHIANGRLLSDEKRARAKVADGQLPEESVGY